MPSCFISIASYPCISGLQGHTYDGHGDVLQITIVNSEIQCTFMCANTNGCYAANFNKKTSTCTLMKRVNGSKVVINADCLSRELKIVG